MKGDFGENIASALIGQWTQQGQLFETFCIGGKWPTIDIYAEIRVPGEQKMFCFFQVKSTELGCTKNNQRLKIKISKEHLNRLSGYHAPTYLIGVDYNRWKPMLSGCYIKTIKGKYQAGISSIETTWPLNERTVLLLRNEVVNFWESLDSMQLKLVYNTIF